MDWDEFINEWFPYHSAKYVGVITWLNKVPKDQQPGIASRKQVLESWHRRVKNCSVDDAKEATDLLGTEGHPEPYGFDRHPEAIVAICLDKKRVERITNQSAPLTRIRGGHSEYTCSVCRDRGDVVVWHPKTMQAARDGTLRRKAERGELYRVSVACANCQAPSPARHSSADRIVFDPQRMLLASHIEPLREGLDELEEFVAARMEQRQQWTADSAF